MVAMSAVFKAALHALEVAFKHGWVGSADQAAIRPCGP